MIQKLDLSGLQDWEPELATQARNLLQEYHDLFSLEKNEIGQTKTVEHKIVLLDPETPPFKERFQRIPPPQVDEVREHLKMMLVSQCQKCQNCPCTVCGKSGLYFSFILQPLTVSLQYDPILFSILLIFVIFEYLTVFRGLGVCDNILHCPKVRMNWGKPLSGVNPQMSLRSLPAN